MWTELVELGARHGHPGARQRAGADPLRQALRRRHHPGRPCHQGRPDRGPPRGRAHGRCRALLRGRRLAPIPHLARGEEPLRPDRRDRRVRDDRLRPARSRQPVRAVPVGARSRLARHRGVRRHRRARGRCWSKSRRWWRRRRSARHGAPWSAGTRAGCRCCWRCWRPIAASSSAATTFTLTSPAACASRSRRPISPPPRRWFPRLPTRRCRPMRSISARCRCRAPYVLWRKRPARLKEAAKLGFTRAVVPEAARAEAGEPGLKVTDMANLTSLVAAIAARGNRAKDGKTRGQDG